MDTTLSAALILGFMLGIKHALDADHVVAVSTIVSEQKHPLVGALVGAFWGLGHTATLFLVGLLVIGFGLVIPERLALSLEFIVGIVLVTLGLQIVWSFLRARIHHHVHSHEDTSHLHFHSHAQSRGHNHHILARRGKPFIVGAFHGLAGSAALMLLILSTISSPLAGFGYILIFGVGSLLGMAMLSTIIGLPFVLSAQRLRPLNQVIRVAAGTVSIGLGIALMAEIGFGQGLFNML
ncbi:MAG: sulfite exporter TauE/SafE family protein [Chloroflexi bacterium]|nr:sulfite exporter TauE/SafE family protein [Chloroflexota bacterium]